MKGIEVEEWALRAIREVKDRGGVEDSRVELKAGLIEASRAARRLAGHANAARGEPLLWLLGVTEDGAIPGVGAGDFANWFAEVTSWFRGPVPQPTERNIFHDAGTFVAVAFSTDQAPYVVRNPAFGRPDGGPVELEVPWREMTAVRSATHNDLLRMLIPYTKQPQVELLRAALEMRGDYDPAQGRLVVERGRSCRWDLDVELFVVPRSNATLVIPVHLLEIEVEESSNLGRVYFEPYYRAPDNTILRPPRDYAISQPGRLRICAAYGETVINSVPADHAKMVARIAVAEVETPVVVTCVLDRVKDLDGTRWAFEGHARKKSLAVS